MKRVLCMRVYRGHRHSSMIWDCVGGGSTSRVPYLGGSHNEESS